MTVRNAVFFVATTLLITPLRVGAAGGYADVTAEVGLEPDQNTAEAITNAKGRGIAAAEKDIQAGVLRVRDYGEPLPLEMKRIDPTTGYQIERIHNCDPHPTKAFLAELEAYNEIMHSWHDKHK